jgi:hypothetical protein
MSRTQTEIDLQDKRTRLRAAILELTWLLRDSEELDEAVRPVLAKELKRLTKVAKQTEKDWDKYWVFYFMGEENASKP